MNETKTVKFYACMKETKNCAFFLANEASEWMKVYSKF